MPDAEDRSQDSAKAKLDAIALAAEAEAEAAEAEALAAAARARARAIRLRREAQAEDEAQAEEADQETSEVTEPSAATAETSESPEPAETPEPVGASEKCETSETSATSEPSETPEPPVASTEPARRGWLAPKLAMALTAATIAVICGLLGVSGWMVWHHRGVVQERQRSATFVGAAKQGVINMTSFDFNKAKEDVQRVLDNATGEFRDDFQKRADDFASVVKDSKVVTEGKVTATAVESMGRDSAVVLVVANESVTNAAGAKNEPRTFRLRVSVTRDGNQIKMSKVEFVL